MPHISNIAEVLMQDNDFMAFVQNKKANGEEVSNRQFVFKILPIAMKKCKDDLFSIIAILNDKNIEEIKNDSFANVVIETKALFENEDMKGFFSLLQTIKTK